MSAELLNIKKIGEDWGGDNLQFTIHVSEEITVDEDKMWEINHNHECEFQWSHYYSYDNMDYTGLFFETVYIDKENLYHKIVDGKVFVEDFIKEMILDDLSDFISKMQGDAE